MGADFVCSGPRRGCSSTGRSWPGRTSSAPGSRHPRHPTLGAPRRNLAPRLAPRLRVSQPLRMPNLSRMHHPPRQYRPHRGIRDKVRPLAPSPFRPPLWADFVRSVPARARMLLDSPVVAGTDKFGSRQPTPAIIRPSQRRVAISPSLTPRLRVSQPPRVPNLPQSVPAPLVGGLCPFRPAARVLLDWPVVAGTDKFGSRQPTPATSDPRSAASQSRPSTGSSTAREQPLRSPNLSRMHDPPRQYRPHRGIRDKVRPLAPVRSGPPCGRTLSVPARARVLLDWPVVAGTDKFGSRQATPATSDPRSAASQSRPSPGSSTAREPTSAHAELVPDAPPASPVPPASRHPRQSPPTCPSGKPSLFGPPQSHPSEPGPAAGITDETPPFRVGSEP